MAAVEAVPPGAGAIGLEEGTLVSSLDRLDQAVVVHVPAGEKVRH